MRRALTIANTQSQVYSVDNLNHFADVLNDIDELAKLQLIPADGAVAEASPASLKSTFTIPITCWTPAMMRWR
ncbi:Gamma-glutamyl-putrescine synthetase [Klebsiella pneumoniae subsp. ozaenae]|uniref:Gamma-glutamyl-putrescine synthetase n=1 Tax=Klebsiella pneumoniae subsp. ozaenae TaxID=574 RepID=A0A378BLA3_KLEPO|nr:Gamma-glutamyl-putrescine synthetase [Klebsiella pneumoniae subsp. ozaenae]